MPNYDYRCTECDHTFEQQLTIARRDEPVSVPCPKCGAPVERYLPSTSGLSYSGSDKKPPEAFKDVLRRMKKAHRRSTINV